MTKTTTTVEEFNAKGALVKKTVTVVEESDSVSVATPFLDLYPPKYPGVLNPAVRYSEADTAEQSLWGTPKFINNG